MSVGLASRKLLINHEITEIRVGKWHVIKSFISSPGQMIVAYIIILEFFVQLFFNNGSKWVLPHFPKNTAVPYPNRLCFCNSSFWSPFLNLIWLMSTILIFIPWATQNNSSSPLLGLSLVRYLCCKMIININPYYWNLFLYKTLFIGQLFITHTQQSPGFPCGCFTVSY